MSHLVEGEKDFDPKALYMEMRDTEPREVGENFAFGPGYSEAISHYFEHDLPPGIPNNLLLDHIVKVLNFPRDRIVPVMADSCSAGGYLENPEGLKAIVPFTNDLDIILFESADTALKFRQKAPILLPYSSTEQALSLDRANVNPNRCTRNRRTKEELRSFLEIQCLLPKSHTSLHLGADEAIKAVFRRITEITPESPIYMPIPQYFDAIDFAFRFRLKVHRLGQDPSSIFEAVSKLDPNSAPVIYMSNPNNPLGYTMSQEELKELCTMLPPDARLILDSTNINRREGPVSLNNTWRSLHLPATVYHIDSFSKTDNLVSERIGIVLSNDVKEAKAMRKFEPPCLSSAAQSFILTSFECHDWMTTFLTIHSFYTKLQVLATTHSDQISISGTNSNFVVIFFKDSSRKEEFLEKLRTLHPTRANAKRILALPICGAGELQDSDFDQDGVLKQTIGRKGILGLPQNAVRLSALNHPVILKCLAKVLA